MFGFSISKLVFTVVVIAAVWYGFKMLNRVGERKQDKVGKGGASSPAAKAADSDTEDMTACSVCGVYVAPASANNCGKAGCPYGA